MTQPSPDAWTLASGTALAALLFAAVGTWPVCLLILALYRRAIARGMRRSRQLVSEARTLRQPAPLAPVREISLVDGGSAPRSRLGDQALRGIRRVQWAYGIAAVGYGVAAVVVFHQVESMEWLPVRSVVLGLIFSWPIVPTLISLTPVGRAERWLIWSGWVAVVVLLLVIGKLPFVQILGGIGLLVVLPALFVLASSARSMRGAAWLVAPSMVLIGLALWELYPVVFALVDGIWVGLLAVPFVAKAMAYLALVPVYPWVLTKIYQEKLIGDETLLLWQWWLVASIVYASLLAPLGGYEAAAGFVPYAVFLAILLGSFLVQRPSKTSPVRLLLLRTFGARRRSTQLLRDLTRQWRWVGSVELITAPDLATEALTPDELVDFISFRLSRRFVRDESMIGRSLDSLDLRPDRDGRYRVNELMCHDDTWRPVVESLISSVDVILLDLRGFGPHNAGVIDELERLVALVPLHKVVALVDDTTDIGAFRSALWHASAFAPPSSPLATDPCPALRVVRSPVSRAGLRQLLDALGSAVESRPAN